MTRSVLSRFGVMVEGIGRFLDDTFFLRLGKTAQQLWPISRLLSVLLAALLVLSLIGAGFAAKIVFLAVQATTSWLVWPILAALLAFIILLELCCASLMNALHGLLRLSYDLGRHRIGVLLTLATLGMLVLAVSRLHGDGGSAGDVILSWGLALTLVALAFWFERVYRRPAYPGFRDFHGDVVSARQYFIRTAHAG